MNFSVQASITPTVAAKLLISNDIAIDESWAPTSARKVLDALSLLQIDDFLQIIDSNHYGKIADIKSIPQFGRIETICNVPSYFMDSGSDCVDYPQLGFYLKQDASATLAANTKFGENHGKAASILGIANCVNKRIVPSALTYAFASLAPCEKDETIKRLLFRIPIVQIILHTAKDGKVNGFSSMSQLMESTQRRRSQCLRLIFRVLKEYNHSELTTRIDNVVWEDE